MLDNEGWTILIPAADSLQVYVADDGSDANDGLSPAAPKLTLQAGYDLLRDGFPDWLNVKRGSSYGILPRWRLSGRSPAEPMVIRDYGDPLEPRPLFDVTGETGGINQGLFLDSNNHPIESLVAHSLHFVVTDGVQYGLRINGAEDILVEGCRFGGCGIIAEPNPPEPMDRITIRRCVVHDVGKTGIFAAKFDDLAIEECVVYNCGLDDTIFNHGLYISGGDAAKESVRSKIRGNWILKSGGNFGLKWRTQVDGICERNVFARNRNTIGISSHDTDTSNGTHYSIDDNAFIDSGNPDQVTGVRGLDIGGVSVVAVAGNLFARSSGTGNPLFHILSPVNESGGSGLAARAIETVSILSNVAYGWVGPAVSFGAADPDFIDTLLNYDRVLLIYNDLQANTAAPVVEHREVPEFERGAVYSSNAYYTAHATQFSIFDGATQQPKTFAEWQAESGDATSTFSEITYTDPNRDLASYAVQSGVGTTEQDLIDALLEQRFGNWNPALETLPALNYFREGFDMPALPAPETQSLVIAG